MPNFNSRLITWFRHKKEKPLKKIARFFVKKGITANMVTFASLFAGIIAIYFLFENHSLFVIFALIHLFLDALDGVVARITKPTQNGKAFDNLVDRLIEFSALIKIALSFNIFWLYIVVLIAFVSQGIYIYSRLQSPVFFSRTLVLLFLVIELPLVAISLAGIINLGGILSQLRWYWKGKPIS